MLGVSYQQFKDLMSTKPSVYPQYIEDDMSYTVMAFDGRFEFSAILKKGTADSDDFEANLKPTCNKQLTAVKDKDGAQVVNPKFAGEGRAYNSLHFEVEIGKPNSLYCKDKDGNTKEYVSMRCLDSAGEITTDQMEAVKTIIRLAPEFDYDIQGFCLYQNQRPAGNIRAWAHAAPDIPASYGGSKEIIGGLNLSLSPYDKTFMDYVGDSATTMAYDESIPQNVLEMLFAHAVGTDHKIMGELFWYV